MFTSIVEHGITGESSLKNRKKFSQDQATFRNLITQKWSLKTISFFLHMKIIRTHSALVTCEYLFWSWHESIFKICCLKSGFYQWQDLCLFWLFFWIFGKMANFEGLWWPNYLTYMGLCGTIWKIISISFIWYLINQFLTTGTATERYRKKWPGLVSIKK